MSGMKQDAARMPLVLKARGMLLPEHQDRPASAEKDVTGLGEPARLAACLRLALPSGTGLLWASQQPFLVVTLPGRRFRDSERAVCILRTQLLLEAGEGWPARAHTEES